MGFSSKQCLEGSWYSGAATEVTQWFVLQWWEQDQNPLSLIVPSFASEPGNLGSSSPHDFVSQGLLLTLVVSAGILFRVF